MIPYYDVVIKKEWALFYYTNLHSTIAYQTSKKLQCAHLNYILCLLVSVKSMIRHKSGCNVHGV